MTETTVSYNFIGILDRLQHMDWHRKADLMSIEDNLYAELNAAPDNLIGLIVMLRCRIMQGNVIKAKALVHKIWSIGGEIPPVIEYTYLNSLLDLGMLDMAMTLLRVRLAEVASVGLFAPAAAKFAVMTGNFNIIEHLAANPETSYFGGLSDFIGVYKQLQYTEHFKNMQRIIFETAKNKMASFEYNTYFDRGITDLEAVVYIAGNIAECQELWQEIEKKINGYFVSGNVKRLNNYCLRVRNISEHPPVFK